VPVLDPPPSPAASSWPLRLRGQALEERRIYHREEGEEGVRKRKKTKKKNLTTEMGNHREEIFKLKYDFFFSVVSHLCGKKILISSSFFSLLSLFSVVKFFYLLLNEPDA
jgi:hypothetical protein